jgi:hypothetical protein
MYAKLFEPFKFMGQLRDQIRDEIELYRLDQDIQCQPQHLSFLWQKM